MITRHYESLSADAQDLFVASMQWMEKDWDEGIGLLRADGGKKLEPRQHSIRTSVWYAFGLLMRNHEGDAVRAARVIDTVRL